MLKEFCIPRLIYALTIQTHKPICNTIWSITDKYSVKDFSPYHGFLQCRKWYLSPASPQFQVVEIWCVSLPEFIRTLQEYEVTAALETTSLKKTLALVDFSQRLPEDVAIGTFPRRCDVIYYITFCDVILEHVAKCWNISFCSRLFATNVSTTSRKTEYLICFYTFCDVSLRDVAESLTLISNTNLDL